MILQGERNGAERSEDGEGSLGKSDPGAESRAKMRLRDHRKKANSEDGKGETGIRSVES